MHRDELQKLEGVWVGTEHVLDAGREYEATARLVFQSVFDGRFLLCDYIQTVPDRPISVGHGVFWLDDHDALTVTWFRDPAATTSQQADAVAESDKLVFFETIDGRTTRTTYMVRFDRMLVRTECASRDGEWTPILEGSYRRR